uniref:Uncharacterized protein n=1 Tax=Stegastes partitus TaxID=144197 RepID=A0A3B5BF09_9TELE
MWSALRTRKKSTLTHKPDDEQFAQEQEEICHFIQDTTHHDVGVSVQELDAFLQTPEAALQTAQQELCKLVLERHTFQLVVQILQQNPDDLNDGEDEGAERQSPCVIPGTRLNSPQGGKHRPGGHVIRLDEGPVVRGEGPVGAPEEEEDVVELEADQVLVVNGLAAVEGLWAVDERRVLIGCTDAPYRCGFYFTIFSEIQSLNAA